MLNNVMFCKYNRKINILNDKNKCHDQTAHYRKITKHIHPPTREEIYVCDGIHVLHLPYCDPSSWGPMVTIV